MDSQLKNKNEQSDHQVDHKMTQKEKKKQKKHDDFMGEVKDFLKDLIVIVIIVLAIRSFIAMPFQINGQSMYSSYYDKEFIIVDRLSYRFQDIKRGDVIVFKPNVSHIKQYYLKRIIGLPGDTVKIEDGNVFIKSSDSQTFQKLDETYLNEENYGHTFIGGSTQAKEFLVPKGEYFVMGDNRNHSTDSRQCFASCSYPKSTHFVESKDITGKVFLDLGYFRMSFKEFGFIHPELNIDTTPRFLDSPKNHEYK